MRTLDPGNLVPGKTVNKQEIKASITDAIARQVVGSNREEIAHLWFLYNRKMF